MSLTRILNGFATKTAAYNLVISDDVVLANGTFTVYLPPAANATGRPFTIKNINTGTVTVSANGAELIDGTTTFTLPANETAIVSSTGAMYHRMGRFSLDANNATNLNGQAASYYLNATNINAGTLAGARMFVANSTVNGAISTTTQDIAGVKTLLANTVHAGYIFANSHLRVDTTNGRLVIPVGTNKYAT